MFLKRGNGGIDLVKCRNCGYSNPEGSKFCENCGAPLEQNQPQQEQPAQSFQKKPIKPKKLPKGHKSIIIGLIIIILLALAAGHDYMKYHKSDDTKTENTKNSSEDHDSDNDSDDKSDSDSSDDDKNESDSDVESLMSKNLSGIKGDTSAYFYDLDDNETASFGDAKSEQRAASDIKVYVMAAAYQKIADGDFSLNDRYDLSSDDKVGGTGIVQSMQVGDSLTYRDLIDYMITKSDNTAANIIIKKVGGIDAVNDEISKLDLSSGTKVERMLMDQDALDEGKDNMTTAYDLAMFMKKLYRHDVVSSKYDKEMLSILSNTSNHSKIPAKINTNVVDVYNKTGEYAEYGVENDAAILKHGKKAFVLVVMSENGDSDEQKDAMASLGKDVTEEVLD